MAVRFDLESLAVVGQPLSVLEGVLMSVNSGVANFDISTSGDLVYVPGGADKGERALVWVDRNGKAESLGLPPRSYLHPRISPDARQLAIEIEGPNHDFYVYDFARSVLSKMSTDGASHWPVWSPDGAQLVYRAGPMAGFKLWAVPADRSHPAAQVPAEGISQSAESWSPDGHAIAYTAVTPDAGAHIMVASFDGSRVPPVRGYKAPPARPSSRQTAVGWRTVRMSPADLRYMCRRFRDLAPRFRSRPRAAPIRCGRGMAGSCSTATATA